MKTHVLALSAVAALAALASWGAEPTKLDPARMGRVGQVDERFQSYNVEMVEVTGGRFWAPYRAEAALMGQRVRWAAPVLFSVAAGVAAARAGAGEAAETGLIKVHGGELYHEVKGAGAAVVLLHAGLLDGRMWDEQFELLSKQCRVIRFDARGHGRSSIPAGDYSNYEDLHDLLVALGVPRATRVGLSLGARTAIDFALAYPAMVDAIVAAAPGLSGWTFDDPVLAEHERGARAAAAAGDRATFVEWFQRSWTDGPKRTPQQIDAAVRERVRAMALETLAKLEAGRGNLKEMDGAGRLGELRVPLLAIVGDLDMSDIHEIVAELVARVPGAREVVIAGAGHMVNLERPAEFSRARPLCDCSAVGAATAPSFRRGVG